MTWCYNRNSTPPSRLSPTRSKLGWSWQGHVTWVENVSHLNKNLNHTTMPSTNALEEQIAALVRQLEETKEAQRMEEVHKEAERKEAEAMAERACQEE